MPSLPSDAAPTTRPPWPRWQRLQRAAAVAGAWTLYGLLIGEQTLLQVRVRGETRSLWSIFAPPLAGAWMWAAFTPLVVAATRQLRRRRATGQLGWPTYLALQPVLGAALMLVGTGVWALVQPSITGVTSPWSTVLAYSIIVDTASYVAIVTLTEAAAYAADYRARDQEAATLARTAADLQGRLDEARLHALEAQLRPHFLHNTLNLVAELVHDEPDAADEMLTRLGLLLRRSYDAGEASAHVVPLSRELEFVLAYADILARRYRDRVSLIVDVPETLRAVRVPAFALQPLVENAFRHGVERREWRSAVTIRGGTQDDSVVLHVIDRSLERTLGAPRRRTFGDPHEGVGLGNTRERLRALYGTRAGLTLDRRPGETTATLWLPLDAAIEDVPHGASHDVPNDVPRAAHG